jgi:hypothetical protein
MLNWRITPRTEKTKPFPSSLFAQLSKFAWEVKVSRQPRTGK